MGIDDESHAVKYLLVNAGMRSRYSLSTVILQLDRL